MNEGHPTSGFYAQVPIIWHTSLCNRRGRSTVGRTDCGRDLRHGDSSDEIRSPPYRALSPSDAHVRHRLNLLRGEFLEAEKDQDRHRRQSRDESPPQPDHAHLQLETEQKSDRQADEPIADDIGKKCESRISSAAKRSDA